MRSFIAGRLAPPHLRSTEAHSDVANVLKELQAYRDHPARVYEEQLEVAMARPPALDVNALRALPLGDLADTLTDYWTNTADTNSSAALSAALEEGDRPPISGLQISLAPTLPF